MIRRLFHPPHRLSSVLTLLALAIALLALSTYAGRDPHQFKIHDEDRPQPKKVTPGMASTPDQPGEAPSDAVVLFGGEASDLKENWRKGDGSTPGWKVEDGALVVVPDSGNIFTKQKFGDCQMHIEWAADPHSEGEAQHRSNSGVFFAKNRYEVQILDGHENQTYADGMPGALYGQYPPLVNASRPAGKWQSYDIIYRRPRFNDDGEVTRPARITVLHNGVLVQECEPLTGPTAHKKRPPYEAHPAKLPIQLQDHGDDPIKFRNIWVRELDESKR
jgi:hypothetical protein